MSTAVARTAAAVAAVRPDIDAATLAKANAAIWAALWPAVERDWMLGVRTSTDVQSEAWRRALRDCGIEDDELSEFARQTFVTEERTTHRLYDDAEAFLEAVSGRYPLAIVTNGAGDTQREKLEVVGISARFDTVVISAEVGFAKPDPRIFRLALDALGVAAVDAWHIGDGLDTDVVGARAAGVRAVWVNRSGTPQPDGAVQPDEEIASLADLPDLLGRSG
jgi:putative hydrolase of the HAD superfamily